MNYQTAINAHNSCQALAKVGATKAKTARHVARIIAYLQPAAQQFSEQRDMLIAGHQKHDDDGKPVNSTVKVGGKDETSPVMEDQQAFTREVNDLLRAEVKLEGEQPKPLEWVQIEKEFKWKNGIDSAIVAGLGPFIDFGDED